MKKPLRVWIAEALTCQDYGQKCTSLAIEHRVGGSAGQHLLQIAIGEDQQDAVKLETIFFNRARDAVQECSGNQTIRCLAFYDGSPSPGMYLDFTVEGQQERPSFEEETEKQQAKRYYGMSMEMVFRQSLALIDREHRAREMDARERETLRRENMDAMAFAKEVMFALATNNHEFRMKEMQFKRDSEMMNKWISYGPALINSLTGQDIFPQSTADTSLIEGIIDHLDEAKVAKIADLGLPAEVMGPLAKRAAEYIEKKKQAQSAAAKALTDGKAVENEIGNVH